MVDHVTVDDPEFKDTFERPAWGHRQQWRSTLPKKDLPRSKKPVPNWEDPDRHHVVAGDVADATICRPFGERLPPLSLQRQRAIDAACSAGRNPWTNEEIPVKAIPQPVRTGGPGRDVPRKWSQAVGKSHTYLVSLEGSHLVKIGASKNPESRLKFLQTGLPMDLYLLWSVPGEYEYPLHQRFAKYRYRGEWFDLRELGDPVTVVTDALNEIRGFNSDG